MPAVTMRRAVILIVLVVGLLGVSARLRLAPPEQWWTDRAAIQRGARDFATGSCISCHTLAGVSTANGAVDLTHEGRRRAPAWLLHEIAHPTSQRPPTPRGQARDLAAYLANLH